MKTKNVVDQISKYSAALGHIVALSISLDKGQAVVTINRGHSPRGEGYEFCTLEWSEHSKGLYWGHYDQTREAAAEDHRARFNQILGVKA